MLNAKQKRALELIMFVVFIILLIIRVDWWWWGAKIEPFIFGWLTFPMLYQLGIWFVGWIVVLITCKYLWSD